MEHMQSLLLRARGIMISGCPNLARPTATCSIESPGYIRKSVVTVSLGNTPLVLEIRSHHSWTRSHPGQEQEVVERRSGCPLCMSLLFSYGMRSPQFLPEQTFLLAALLSKAISVHTFQIDAMCQMSSDLTLALPLRADSSSPRLSGRSG